MSDEQWGDGGESACYAHLLCLECGAVLDGHPQPCPSATATTVASERDDAS